MHGDARRRAPKRWRLNGTQAARLRIERGLTLAQLGDQIGRTASHLNRIESGDRDASDITIARIANALGVPVAEITAADRP